MAVRDLCLYPDPVLRQECQPIIRFDEESDRLITDLGESMYTHCGVGLAAPQLGVTRRALVVDVGQREGKSELIELFNPEIVEVGPDKFEWEEGCLSFPDEMALLRRPACVRVRALDRQGRPFEITAENLLATAIQHEMDHLDGILFIDYLSRLRRSLIERRLRKRAQNKER